MDKISYALGLSLGNNLRKAGVEMLNISDLAQGIEDILKGNNLKINLDGAQALINDFFQELDRKQEGKNIEAGKTFLAENGKRSEVTTLPSGLQYEIIEEGNGPVPKSSDRVKVHYHGTLINGDVFDSSVQRGEPASFGVTQVIPGWVEALQLMPVGSKWRLFIPSNLAYGAQGAGQTIAPHSTLIFDVELLDIA
jgi:FKBP-type peptidyl-prolyl cis-trans isomerase FklB